VRIRFASSLVLVALPVCSPAAALGAAGNPTPSNPTPAQIRTAVKQAGRSPDLWATVNVCNTQHHPDTLGIRGQMPALGFSSQLWMTITVDFWDSQQKRFRLDPKVSPHAVAVGKFRFGAHQAGTTINFFPHAGRFQGTILFQWKRFGKVVGHLIRTTTGGHKHVDQSDPRGHSASTCWIS
jgi:hypothetical protein